MEDRLIRLLDILLSIAGIFLLLPLFILISFILKITGENKILYKQKRVGKNKNFFYLYKFATMLSDSPNIGSGELTQYNDPRVLPVGKFLRKTKVNELPQIFNILLGDMSIIGPRPLVEEGEENYTLDASTIIRSIRPGITGIGSIILRDEESYYAHRRDAKEFYIRVISPYKQSLELWYVNNKSSFLNVKINMNNKNNLVVFNNRLKKIDLIDDFYVQQLNKDYVLVKIKYLGKIKKIINKLNDLNINLKMIEGEWRLKII